MNIRSTGRATSASFLAAALAVAMPVANAADAYPCSVLKIVSPYPPGGTTDILARLLAPGLAKGLGVPVIVDNKAGASSNIGTESVVRAQPDGCTALLGNNTGIVINRNLYKFKYDPTRDLAAVGLVASTPLLLYVNADLPAKNVAELVDLMKKAPDKYSYASGGSGSPQHLLGELIKLQKSVSMVHIPYRGQAPAMQDVLGGTVPIAFETITALTPQLKSPPPPHPRAGHHLRAAISEASRRPDHERVGIRGFRVRELVRLFRAVEDAGTPRRALVAGTAEGAQVSRGDGEAR